MKGQTLLWRAKAGLFWLQCSLKANYEMSKVRRELFMLMKLPEFATIILLQSVARWQSLRLDSGAKQALHRPAEFHTSAVAKTRHLRICLCASGYGYVFIIAGYDSRLRSCSAVSTKIPPSA